MRRLIRTAGITALVAAAILVAVAPAGAATSTLARPAALPLAAVSGGSYYAVAPGATHVSNYKDTSILIGRCYVNDGAGCSISKDRQASVTVGLSLGVSRGIVTGGLNITGSTSITLTLGCTLSNSTSPKELSAYPVGNYYTYKVQQWSFGYHSPAHVVATSGTLHAFVADPKQIDCAVTTP